MEEIKCECCDDYNFIKSMYNKEHKILIRMVTKGKSGVTNHETHTLNYCPMCGRKLGD